MSKQCVDDSYWTLIDPSPALVVDGCPCQIKVLVSGGSSLPVVLEDFFEMIRATVIVGYGMTETSPVITNRYTQGLTSTTLSRAQA